MMQSRTHTCNELRMEHVGQTVTLAGFLENVREVGQNFAFAVLRDFYGVTQVVVENEAMWKAFKGLKKENLRDNMSTLELALNMLAEATTTELTNAQNPQGLEENRVIAKQGGAVAGNARKEIESKTGRPVVTSENANTMLLGQTVAGMIESVATEKDDEKSE